MKKIIAIMAALAATTASATIEDGVSVLGAEPTDQEIEMVRAGAKKSCAEVEDYEEKEQCAMDYYTQHNYEGEPDCE